MQTPGNDKQANDGNPNLSGKEIGSTDRSCTGKCIPDKHHFEGTNARKKKRREADRLSYHHGLKDKLLCGEN